MISNAFFGFLGQRTNPSVTISVPWVPFFRDGVDVTHHQRVCTDAKILISLKYLAYGCSVNAFRDYFQLGESTSMLCVRKFTSSIANSIIQKKFFSFFTTSDAKRVEALH